MSTYTITLRDLKRDVSIGIYDHEKAKPQPVLINVDLTVARPARFEDDIEQVLNYESLVNGIDDIISEGHIDLIEVFAQRILHHCESLPGATHAKVRAEKTEIFKDCGGVSVELESL